MDANGNSFGHLGKSVNWCLKDLKTDLHREAVWGTTFGKICPGSRHSIQHLPLLRVVCGQALPGRELNKSRLNQSGLGISTVRNNLSLKGTVRKPLYLPCSVYDLKLRHVCVYVCADCQGKDLPHPAPGISSSLCLDSYKR